MMLLTARGFKPQGCAGGNSLLHGRNVGAVRNLKDDEEEMGFVSVRQLSMVAHSGARTRTQV